MQPLETLWSHCSRLRNSGVQNPQETLQHIHKEANLQMTAELFLYCYFRGHRWTGNTTLDSVTRQFKRSTPLLLSLIWRAYLYIRPHPVRLYCIMQTEILAWLRQYRTLTSRKAMYLPLAICLAQGVTQREKDDKEKHVEGDYFPGVALHIHWQRHFSSPQPLMWGCQSFPLCPRCWGNG